jgi:signal transduction histidine kinase/CheY-like chemotaxis protein
MLSAQIKIYAKNQFSAISFYFVIGLFLLGTKYLFLVTVDSDFLLLSGVLLIMILLSMVNQYHMCRKVMKAPSIHVKDVRIYMRRMTTHKVFQVFLWLGLLFFPYQDTLLYENMPGFIFVFCAIAILTAASAVVFRLYIIEVGIHVCAAAVIIALNFDVQETGYVGLFLLLFAAYSLFSARTLHQSSRAMIDTGVKLKKAYHTAKQAEKDKADFFAMVSHEIRTPMNGIMGVLELLKDQKMAAEHTRSLDVIRDCSHALLNTVNDVIDLTRAEGGTLTLLEKDFDLRALLGSIITIIQPLADNKNLQLSFNIDDDVPAFIHSDPNRIQQIVVNFLNNATKFTDQGSITLKVFCALNAPDTLRFEVIDTGIGIPKQSQSKLFQKFSQIEGGLSRSVQGAGLGLSITKQIITLMKGRIGVFSEEDQGSTFWFEIPLAAAQAIEGAVNITQNIAPMNILVADDNELNRTIAKGLLEKRGHTTTLVNDGQQAFESASTTAFDLIFMDIQMPVLDGIEATKQIRHANIETPIIGLSAYVQQEQIDKMRAAGGNDYLSKPFEPKDLDDVLGRYGQNLGQVSEEGEATKGSKKEDNHVPSPSFFQSLAQEMGFDYAQNFVQDSLAQTHILCAQIKDAHARKDFKTMAFYAHDLGGLCRQLDLKKSAHFAQKLETTSHNDIDNSRPKMMAALSRHLKAETAAFHESLSIKSH